MCEKCTTCSRGSYKSGSTSVGGGCLLEEKKKGSRKSHFLQGTVEREKESTLEFLLVGHLEYVS